MKYTHFSILLLLSMLLLWSSSSSAQGKYWNLSLRSVSSESEASLYSEESKVKKEVTRTYYRISDKHKYAEEIIKKGKVILRKFYWPNEALHMTFGYDPDKGLDLTILHDEQGNPILKKEKGKIKAYFSDARPRKILQTIQEGRFLLYYDSGEKMMSKVYLAGREVGPTQFFYKNGQIRSSVNIDGRNQRFWNENGQLTYASDSISDRGERFNYYWDEEGNLTQKVQTQEGLYHGTHTYYYSNGKPSILGQNLDGKKSGTWKFFKDQGEPLLEIDFDTKPDSLRGYDSYKSIYTIAREDPNMDTNYITPPFEEPNYVVVEQEPEPINLGALKSIIGYPRIAIDAGIQGQVLMRVLVDKEGKVVQYKVVSEVHPILRIGVEKYIAYLQFSPAIQGGKPILFWVNVPFNFKLLD